MICHFPWIPLADTGFLLPTTDLILQIQNHLAADGLGHPEPGTPRFIFTLAQLTTRLLQDAGQTERLLLPREQELILLDLLKSLRKQNLLRSFQFNDQQKGLAQSLLRSITTCKENGIDCRQLTLAAAAVHSGRLTDLATVYTAYEKRKKSIGCIDAADQPLLLLNLLQNGEIPALFRNLKALEGSYLYHLNKSEQALLQKLQELAANRAVDCSEPPALAQWKSPPDLHFFAAPDLRRETREMVRRVKQSLTEGIAPQDWCLAVRDETVYFPLLMEALQDASLPFSCVAREAINRQPFCQAMLTLLDAAASLHQFNLTLLLRQPLLNQEADLAQRLAGLWRAEGLSGDWDAWFARLAAAERRNSRLAALQKSKEEDALNFLILPSAFFTDGRRYLEQWQQDLAQLPTTATPEQFREAILHLMQSRRIDQNLHRLAEIDLLEADFLLQEKRQRAAWQGFLQAMQQLSATAPLLLENGSWTLAEYISELKTILKGIQLTIPFGHPAGVRLGSPSSLRGQHFYGVALLGLNDAVFPRYPVSDWILEEESKRELRACGFIVPEISGLIAKEEALFRGCLQMAKEQLLLSYSLRSNSGEALSPSPYLLHLQLAFPEAYRIQSIPASPYEVALADTVSITEAKQAERARQPRQAEKVEALHCDPALIPLDLINSPSSYLRYQDCPYAYFLNYLLQLQQPQATENALSALDRGTLMHRILEELTKAWQQPLYTASPPDLAACRQLIAPIVEKLWQKPELLESTPLLWQAEGQRFLRLMTTWLTEEAALFQQKQARPFLQEWKFGDDPAALLRLPGCRYPLHGKIDRVDLRQSSSGQAEVLLYDYKSGRAENYQILKTQPLEDVQLLCYMLVWQALRPEKALSAAYYFPGKGSDGQPKLVEAANQENWQTLQAETLALLAEIDRQISLGNFTAKPKKKETCSNCSYLAICRREAI